MLYTILMILGAVATVVSLVSAYLGLRSRSESASVTLTTDGSTEAYNISLQAVPKVRSQLQHYAEEETSRLRATKPAAG